MSSLDHAALEAACLSLPGYVGSSARGQTEIRHRVAIAISTYLQRSRVTLEIPAEDVAWLAGLKRPGDDPFESHSDFAERARHNEHVDRILRLVAPRAEV